MSGCSKLLVAPLLLGLAVIELPGCRSRRVEAVPAATVNLPRYTPAEAALFDDTVGMEVFGFPENAVAPHRDPKTIERTKRADGVVRARVATVTRERPDGAPAYRISLQPVGASLAGATPESALELFIEAHNPSAPLIHAWEGRFVGQVLVVFYRTYDDAGEVRTHFRAEVDSHEVHDAVERAKLLDEVPH